MCHCLYAQAETRAYPDASIYHKPKAVAWWIIILAVFAGILLLLLIVFIFYKVRNRFAHSHYLVLMA